METAEEHFEAPLSSVEGGYRRVFNLNDKEYLFHGEGWSWSDLLPFVKRAEIRAFTAGELYEGLVRARHIASEV